MIELLKRWPEQSRIRLAFWSVNAFLLVTVVAFALR